MNDQLNENDLMQNLCSMFKHHALCYSFHFRLFFSLSRTFPLITIFESKRNCRLLLPFFLLLYQTKAFPFALHLVHSFFFFFVLSPIETTKQRLMLTSRAHIISSDENGCRAKEISTYKRHFGH